jgi:hypothetical protein
MTFQQIAAIGGFSALLALTGVACSDGSKTPTAPTAAVAGDANGGATVAANAGGGDAANADGSTLKVAAPGGLTPANRVRVDSLTPSLAWTQSAARFASTATLGYQIEIYEVNTLISTVEASALTYAFTTALKYDTVYRWRVRAKVGTDVGPWATTVDFQTPLPPPPPPPTFGGGGGGGGVFGPQRNIGINEAQSLIIDYHNAIRADLGSRSTRDQRVEFLYAAVGIVAYGHPQYNPKGGDPDWCVKDAGGGRPPSDDVLVRCSSREAWDLIGGAGGNGYSWHQEYLGRLPSNQNVYSPPISSLPGGGGPSLPPSTGPVSPVNGRTPDPPAGQRLPLPDMQAQIAQWTAERPDLFPSQQCPRGIKYVNSPWQDYIMDKLRQVDTRWGYNAKPTRTAADNGGVPVVAAGDEILYHYSGGPDQGSTEVYAVDMLEQHCGNPRLTWRVFTGEERVIWTGASRF